MRLDVIERFYYISEYGEQKLSQQQWWRTHIMKIWTKPAVREQEVGLEVTSYLPAEIDVI